MTESTQNTCKRGHDLSGAGVRIRKSDGQRICIRCHRLSSAKSYARKAKQGWQWRRRLKKYGLTEAAFDAMLAAQGRRCPICRAEIRRPYKAGAWRGEAPGARVVVTGDSIAIDYDHTSAIVRGLLCSRCKSAIGLMHDDAERMRRAAEYIERTQGRVRPL